MLKHTEAEHIAVALGLLEIDQWDGRRECDWSEIQVQAESPVVAVRAIRGAIRYHSIHNFKSF
ncbi:hypothetical protein NB231_17073 [Nitrococcus mobilis Nb-231]|uniref:Uncharacterized protein n=1 Tax=Nitrococcus mobilis Nb-231 TaxID=314278 RepID=A4BML5_9GAMM|nr:hypothetical protein NB231_17073 [Nitrococcus mobilis Nb-231]